MPPARRGSLLTGFTGAPATRAVLDGRRAPRPLLRLLADFGQRGNAHFHAGALDARAFGPRPRGLRHGSLGVIRGLIPVRLIGVVLLLALAAAAQASRGVEISGG